MVKGFTGARATSANPETNRARGLRIMPTLTKMPQLTTAKSTISAVTTTHPQRLSEPGRFETFMPYQPVIRVSGNRMAA
jgi:hypothetical protein